MNRFNNEITLAGLGAGSPDDLTLGTWQALKAASRIILRTGRHPVVEWLRGAGIQFDTFDHLYEEAGDFPGLYARMAREVIAAARLGPVLYAVPGHPLVAEDSVRLVMEEAAKEGLALKILPAVSFLDALVTTLRLDPADGLQVVDGLLLEEKPPLPARPAVITQVYSRLVASEAKLALLDIYPPEHPVTVVRGAGLPGGEVVATVPLYEVDRLDWIDHLTSLYLPALEPARAKGGQGTCPPVPKPGQEVGQGDRSLVPLLEVVEAGQEEPACRFPLDPLVQIMARLRAGEGCPWDREQDHQTLRPFLLEEAYEVLEALDEGDMNKLCEELGDLLLQIVFHAQIGAENGNFNINCVINGISEKLVRRHPHVFSSATARNSSEVILSWERIKVEERKGAPPKGPLGGVPYSLPALMRAARLQKRAARVGFDWPDYTGALQKTLEEIEELAAVVETGDREQIERELGDLLFSTVNLARLLGIEAEVALSGTSRKFVKRFTFVEEMARRSGKKLEDCTLAEMDAWWEVAKHQEKKDKTEKI